MNELPEGWATAKLGDIAKLNPRHSNGEIPDSTSITFLPMSAVEAETGRVNRSLTRPWSAVKKGYTTFQDGDVLFAKITPCMENGKLAVCSDLLNGFGAGSTEFHVLRPTSAILDARYLFFYLLQRRIRGDARAAMKGAAGQLRVPAVFLERLAIPLPPLAEQPHIVAEIEKQFTRLDSADSLIQAAREKGEALTPRIPAVLASGREMHWTPLSHLFSDGSYGTSTKCTYEWSGTPVIRIPNIVDGNVCYENIKYANAVMAEDACIAPNDFLIVRTNGSRDLIGRAALVRETPTSPHAFASYLIRLKLDPARVNPEWIGLIWNAPQIRSQLVSAAATSAGQYNVSLTALKKIKVPVPDRTIQDKLIQQVAAAASLARRASGSIALTKKRSARLRQAILAKAFSGQLVPQDPNDEPASVLLDRIRAIRASAATPPRSRRWARKAEAALQST